ncbi:MAG TPA: META domain-containing protein [Methanomicrobiales archaeon]|nr:META domain-containing protein [Methanomicrobiales archaeon]
MKGIIPALVVAAVLIAGCTAPAPSGPGTPGGNGAGPAGTSWVLASMADAGGNLTPVPASPPITLEFRDAATVGGSGGCNVYGGSYETNGIRINISRIVSTLRYCVDTAVDERESAYLGLLGRARFFRIDGDSLRFFDGEGSEMLAFLRASPVSATPLVGTRWVLESVAAGAGAVSSVIAGTEIDAVFANDGSVSGSAGCNSYFAMYTTEGGSLTIGPVGTTKKYCGVPAGIMEQEQTFIELLGQVSAYGIEGDQLELTDVGGNGLLWFRPAAGL